MLESMLGALVLLCCATLATSVPLHDDVTPRAGESCGYESCTQAEAGVLNIHIVPHTHDDVGWLKTVDEYYYGSRNNIQKAGVQYILDSVIRELWEDPKRRFVYIETAFFWKWWMRQSEDVQQKVHTLVRQGRLQFAGGAWSMNDEAASHYQSTVDQFTWGLSKLNQTFGACGRPHVGWQIDPFGHSREFASLLAAMGYDGLFLGRIDYQDKLARKANKAMETVWRGDDDLGKASDIFTGVLYNTYQPPPGFCFDVLCSDEPVIDDENSPLYNVEQRIGDFLAFTSEQASYYRTTNVILTMGGDFTYQDANMWYRNLDKLIEYTNIKAAKEGLKVKMFYSTPDCYLKAVKDANPTLPTKQDDFFPYASDPDAFWTGYFTSRPTTKYFEREGNNYLQMVKQLQVLAGLEEHNQFVINELRSAMGIMQHHDAITGTEKQAVTFDYERILDQAVEDALIVARQAFNKVTQGGSVKPVFSYDRCHLNESRCETSENSRQFVVTVYNHLAWYVNESVRMPVVEGEYEVYAPNGDKITSQLVDIPGPVLAIPSRKSKATHEIVFIAYLKPISFKSYYIKKTTKKVKREIGSDYETTKRYERKNDYYTDMNDYWKQVKDQVYLDIHNIEDKPIYKTIRDTDDANIFRKNRIPDVPEYGPGVNFYTDKDIRRVKNAKDFNLEVLKDDKDVISEDILQLEKIIRDAKGNSEAYKSREGLDKKMMYPSLNDEEMRMLSDEPRIVERFYDESYLDNGLIRLRIDNSGSITHAVLPDATQISLNIKYFFYPGCYGDNGEYKNRSSGAYIFRPNATTPISLIYNYTQGPIGPIVKELRATMSENVATFVRMYDGLNYIENEWIVGPIDVEDGVGKEFIVKYVTDIVNNGEFYTDSNGRQMLKRKLNQRPQWNLTLDEPVAGNYYPITNKIFIKDDDNKVAILTDRSEGGSSLEEGQIELMLHRRLLHDDAFGVGEALNETFDGKGLIVRGRHRIYLSKSNNKDEHIEEKKQVLQFHLQPQVFISDANDVSFDDWMKTIKAYSWANALPNGLHLLTLEPWFDNSLLMRLENYLETTDKVDSTIEIDLTKIFKTLKVKAFKETTLDANQWLEDSKKWYWDVESEFSGSFNDAYGSFGRVESAKDVTNVEDDGFKVKIKAKQIRTFVVNYEF